MHFNGLILNSQSNQDKKPNEAWVGVWPDTIRGIPYIHLQHLANKGAAKIAEMRPISSS